MCFVNFLYPVSLAASKEVVIGIASAIPKMSYAVTRLLNI